MNVLYREVSLQGELEKGGFTVHEMTCGIKVIEY